MQHVVDITTTKLSKIYYVFGNKYTACISNIYVENEQSICKYMYSNKLP